MLAPATDQDQMTKVWCSTAVVAGGSVKATVTEGVKTQTLHPATHFSDGALLLTAPSNLDYGSYWSYQHQHWPGAVKDPDESPQIPIGCIVPVTVTVYRR